MQVDADRVAGPSRWFGVGATAGSGSRGDEAALTAIAGRSDPKLFLIFAGELADLEQTGRQLDARWPDVPAIGCTTAGEISASGSVDQSVVVAAFGGAGFTVGTGSASVVDAGPYQAAAEAARTAMDALPEEAEGSNQLLLILSDGLAGDQQEVVRGAYSVAGAVVPLVGGCAGDGLRMVSTSQLHGSATGAGQVVIAAIASDGPFGIGVQHGWQAVGDAMVVTASRDTRVHSLNGKPALDVYLDRLGAPAAARSDPDAFTTFAMTHPLGLDRRGGVEVRFVAEANFEDRSLGCIAEVPEGGMAHIMEGSDESVLTATDEACTQALRGLDGSQPIGLVAFDCIARRGVLGETRVRQEIDRIGAVADGAPVAGFYTYGEIARTEGSQGFHNQTLVVLAVG